jgi:MerR family transcriptional regulator, copper efflux regulator
MGQDGLLIGDVAARTGTTRKSLRRYEAAGILPPPRRTAAGYRLYSHESFALLVFVARARRLGFTLEEIREIVSIKRSGRAPCAHVRDLVHRKTAELDRTMAHVGEVRRGLRALLERSRARSRGNAVVCHCIEDMDGSAARANTAVGRRAKPSRRLKVPRG